tara:strand:+ start:218 stop:508 length:291 start_codon:yes stop_codon:yes gene_type:complete
MSEYYGDTVLFKDCPITSMNIFDKSLNEEEQIIQWKKEKEYDRKLIAQWPNGIPVNTERADQLVLSGEISLPASAEDTHKIGWPDYFPKKYGGQGR